ncbi:MAG: sugar ABC transporter substrate-binding protein [Actinomyces urogenitalis]|uniref:ABC transporter substrate-binding protein n=1 Tax=Actinomyces urogenitalis TaxID=103621 RepID=UPI00290D0D1D|nr:sugar ABC transporter substrate-binding protein [Actinomyces urogenitalis]MDU6150684.1 sugar ABC transporter substrate-binding protein [Actinomyces urogenitalis]
MTPTHTHLATALPALRSPLSRRGFLCGLVTAAGAATLAACSSSADRKAGGPVEYWLWDSAQEPAYEACAARFEEKTGIKVNITQVGWGDYWTKLTAGFIAGTGPDVFTDHIAKFAQFVDLDVLVPLDEQPAWADVDESAFHEGLIDLWKGEDGKQYGCPKDWDTEAIFYNKTMLAEAGLSESDLEDWDWNPEDGGSFEKILARLTVDKNGVRGDEEGFDPTRVAVYGIGISDAGSNDGQTTWSPFTSTISDWMYTDKETWGTRYRYDDPDFQRAMDWYFGLIDKGYMPPAGTFSTTTGTDVQLGSGSIAMCINGAWMFNIFAGLDIDLGLARHPIGPNGKSMSLLNGLGDSIVKQSKNIENASKWVAFLGTKEAQDIVASYGIVFPAISSSTELAVAKFEETGLSTKPFTDHVKEGTTFYFPLTYFGADVKAIMTPGVDALWVDREPASTLTAYNEQVNLLFKTSAKE